MNKKLSIISTIGIAMIWLIFSIGMGSAGSLISIKVTKGPIIDGIPDIMWNQAPAMKVNVSGGANAGFHTVTLKSIYTDDSVYFLAKWNDSTKSQRRLPWQKQANGVWKRLQTPNAKEGGENTYYEDKLSQIWNINITGFDGSGCSTACHAGENSNVKAYGNMYTANGEIGDIWHMKTVRTNPTGYVDDQYLDSTHYSNDTSDAGRHSDPGLVPYYDNINTIKTMPNFTSADQPAPPYWIFDNKKQKFKDTYNVSDEIAGIIVKSPTGDRANIKGKAVYKNGYWTLEYGRRLKTGSIYDVQFSDLKKKYLFGTAIFDNAQTMHSYETGTSRLIFAPSITVVTPNGAEIWPRGTIKEIKWRYTGNPGPNVKIELWKGGKSYKVITSNTSNDRSYMWSIPRNLVIGTNYKIRIKSTTSSPADTSDKYFTIAGINVDSPNGGEIWSRNTLHTIKWSYKGNPGPNVRIELWKSGMLNKVIASNTLNDGSYTWKVPNNQKIGADYKVKIKSTTNPYWDTSDNNFRIK